MGESEKAGQDALWRLDPGINNYEEIPVSNTNAGTTDENEFGKWKGYTENHVVLPMAVVFYMLSRHSEIHQILTSIHLTPEKRNIGKMISEAMLQAEHTEVSVLDQDKPHESLKDAQAIRDVKDDAVQMMHSILDFFNHKIPVNQFLTFTRKTDLVRCTTGQPTDHSGMTPFEEPTMAIVSGDTNNQDFQELVRDACNVLIANEKCLTMRGRLWICRGTSARIEFPNGEARKNLLITGGTSWKNVPLTDLRISGINSEGKEMIATYDVDSFMVRVNHGGRVRDAQQKIVDDMTERMRAIAQKGVGSINVFIHE